MIQLQALNYIIANKDINFLSVYDEKYFSTYKDEYNFIVDHVRRYKNVPDIETVLEKFKDFGVVNVTESADYLKTKLFEEFLYTTSVEVLTKGADMYAKDSRMATNYIISKLKDIKPPETNYGIDIIQSATTRYDRFLDKFNNMDTNEYEISTGLDELDMLLGKLRRGEEFVVIYARTNNAKTWVAEKMATSAWEAGENVGFFSPEMSDIEIGYRFDALFKHFSNKGMSGRERDFNPDNYGSYIKKLKKYTNKFNVTDPLTFDKEPTVSKLRKWVEDMELSIIFIDGINYLYNERGNNKKESDRLTEIAEDLMLLSKEKKIPVIAVMQANRTAARDANGEVNDDTPELDTIRNSDGISHNASRAIAVRYKDQVLTLKITKDRYSDSVGAKLIYNCDLNTGKFTYLPNPKAKLPENENEKIAEESREQFKDSDEVF